VKKFIIISKKLSTIGETMTRKHYKLIAEAIKQAMFESFSELAESDEETKNVAKNYVLDALTNVIFQVALTLEEDNPNFDRKKFADACMVSSS